jgi:lipoyl-dependent peroxiredoxin
MPTSILYTAIATATGDGRDGHARSSDGVLEVDLATPKELGGAGGAKTNPEQLFAAGYSACFHSALKASSKKHGVPITDSSVTAEVGIGRRAEGGMGLAVTLHIELGGVSQEDAEKAAAVAHQLCPYSNATRGNVDVVLDVTVG